MGKVASGKGTQGHAVAKHFGGAVYSNGNKLRETVPLPTVFGKKMKETYEAGYLMPEWIASYWMTHALVTEHLDERIIFEGVARKPNEAELFHDIHEWIGRPYVVFNLYISDDEVRMRTAARARDVVDSAHTTEKRLEEYHTYTVQSIDYFRSKGKVVDINGSASQETVQDEIFKHLTK